MNPYAGVRTCPALLHEGSNLMSAFRRRRGSGCAPQPDITNAGKCSSLPNIVGQIAHQQGSPLRRLLCVIGVMLLSSLVRFEFSAGVSPREVVGRRRCGADSFRPTN